MAGIAEPARFFDALRATGIGVEAHGFPDHHAYTPADLDFGDDAPVLMTEKDAVKCAAFARENPAQYRLMFASNRPDFAQQNLAEAATAAFQNLVDGVGASTADSSPLESVEGRQRVARLWGIAHGLSDLLLSGHMKFLTCHGEESLRADLEAILWSSLHGRD